MRAFMLFLVLPLGALLSLVPLSADPGGFHETLERRCFDCHGDGMDEGGLALDRVEPGDRNAWALALRRVARGAILFLMSLPRRTRTLQRRDA